MEDESRLLSILNMSAEELQAIREEAAREREIELEVMRQMGVKEPKMCLAEFLLTYPKDDDCEDIDIMEVLREADELSARLAEERRRKEEGEKRGGPNVSR